MTGPIVRTPAPTKRPAPCGHRCATSWSGTELGPKKLLWLLGKRHDRPLPAPSTVAARLKREGFVRPWRRSVQRPHPGRPLSQATHPNAIWTTDFKGHFRTQDGRYCYPLTVVDAYSRYCLDCRALL